MQPVKIKPRTTIRAEGFTTSVVGKSTVSQPAWEPLRAAEAHLVKSTTLDALDHYVSAVRDMLSKALTKQAAEVSLYMSPRGRFRQMVFVRQLNEELAILHREVRDGRPGSDLMKRLDAIRGILVDLWL